MCFLINHFHYVPEKLELSPVAQREMQSLLLFEEVISKLKTVLMKIKIKKENRNVKNLRMNILKLYAQIFFKWKRP